MQKFLDLKRNPDSKVPPITELLARVGNDKNTAFKKIANSLFFSDSLNPVYSLVSLREIIQLSPINTEKETKPDDLNPASSYKWLTLIYSLAAKTISTDAELEHGKVEFLFTKIVNYVLKIDSKNSYSLHFAIGLLCMTARIIDEIEDKKTIPQIILSDEFYSKLIEILNNVELPPEDQAKAVATADFSEQDILTFALPVSLEFITPNNIFCDLHALINSSILRVLLRILPLKLPKQLEEFKNAVIVRQFVGLTKSMREKVLVLLFSGDEKAAFRYSDSLRYAKHISKVRELFNSSKKFTLSLSYKESIELSKSLRVIKEVSTNRVEHWIEFTQENNEVAEMLGKLAMSGYHEDFVIAAVTLLRSGTVKVHGETIPFLMQLLISASSAELREESSQLLLENAEEAANEIIRIFPEVCNCGSRSESFFSFLEKAIPKIGSKSFEAIKALLASIRDSNDSLKKLPNTFIYTEMSQYIDIKASYLDPRPCMICNNPEIQPTRFTIDEVRQNEKYTHDQYFIKLRTPLIIQGFELIYSIKKASRLPRVVKIYISSVELNDANELLFDKPNWRHICDLTFEKDQIQSSEKLPLSLYATCVQFHFTEFWEEPQSNKASCPICHRGTPDPRSGLCSSCHENIYQCRNCRNINYSHLDGFICSECGVSNFVSFDWKITAIRSFSNTKIDNENDCDASLTKIDGLLANAHEKFAQLTNIKNDIEKVIAPTYNGTMSEKTSRLNSLYNDTGKRTFQELTGIVQHACAIKSAVGTYKNRITHNLSHTEFNMCYNCRTTYIRNAINFLGILSKIEAFHEFIDSVDIPSLLIEFSENHLFGANAISSLTTFCKLHSNLNNRIIKLFSDSLPNPSLALVNLLCTLESINDEKRGERLHTLISAVDACIPHLNSTSSFIPLVLQPLVTCVCSSPLIIKSHNAYIMNNALNVLLKSKGKTSKNIDPLDVFDEKTLTTLLTKCRNSTVRSSVAGLLKSASDINNEHLKRVASFVTKIVLDIASFSEEDEECFGILQHILSKNINVMIHEISEGFVEKLVSLLKIEVNKTVEKEGEMVLDLNVGHSIFTIMETLNIFIKAVTQIRFIVIRKPAVAEDLIHCYFQLKSLFVQRSKYLDSTISTLRTFIMNIMQKEFVNENDYATENTENVDNVQDNQQQQQQQQQQFFEFHEEEDFNDYDDNGYGDMDMDMDYNNNDNEEPIQHQAPQSPSREPIKEPEVEGKSINVSGPSLIMRSSAKCIDICPEIAIRELCSIVFPVKEARNIPIVTRKIRTQEDFMPGRLSNQPIMSKNIGKLMRDIKNKICNDLGMPHLIEDDHGMELLVNNNIIALDLKIEEVYEKIWEPAQGSTPMMVICRLQGLDGEATEPMIENFPRTNNNEEKPEIKYQYTTALIESGGLKALVDALLLQLPSKSIESLIKLFGAFICVDKNVEAMNGMKAIENLFELMKTLIDQTDAALFESVLNITQKLINANKAADTLPEDHISFIFTALEKPLVQNNEQLVGPVLSLAPLLASRSKHLTEKVLKFFLEKIQPENEDNAFEKPRSLFMLNGFAEFTLALPVSQEGNEARAGIFATPITKQAFAYLTQVFPMDQPITSPKWMEGVQIPTIPALLKFLSGLVRGFEPAQRMLLENENKDILLIIALSNVASTANIGEFASNVIESIFAQPSFIANELKQIQDKIAADARAKAQAEREKAIENAAISPDILKMIDEIGDENDWECCICKEGLGQRPNEQLFLYVYSNRIGDFCNTATHFILVHPNCHSNTRTRDQKGKQTLSEWEAAMVRNCERPCNALFPLPSSAQKPSDYRNSLVSYLSDRCRSSDYFKDIFMDVLTHLRNFAKNEPIPFSCGGGSVPNVVALIPFLVYAGNVILDTDNNESRNHRGQEVRMEKLLQTGESSEEMAALAFWTLSIEEWNHVKAKILKFLIKEQNADTFEKAKRPLTLFILVDKMMNTLFQPSGAEAQEKDGSMVVSSKVNAQYVSKFNEVLLGDPLSIKDEWVSLGEEVEDEIMELSDLKTALIMAGISLSDISPEEWLKNELK